MAIASASWAAVSFNTPIREATHSWFPEGYKVAVAPAKTSPTTEPETTATEDSEQTAGKQRDTTPETTEARNRVPVTASQAPSDDDSDQRSDDNDDPAPEQPDPKPTKQVPAPPTTGPTAPPSDDPEPQPTVTERPTSQPTNDPGPSDDGGGDDDDEEDGGIIDIDIELPLPLPLVAAPGPEASSTGTNSLVETGIPGAVPGTGKQTSVKLNVADLATWTFFVWQSLA